MYFERLSSPSPWLRPWILYWFKTGNPVPKTCTPPPLTTPLDWFNMENSVPWTSFVQLVVLSFVIIQYSKPVDFLRLNFFIIIDFFISYLRDKSSCPEVSANINRVLCESVNFFVQNQNTIYVSKPYAYYMYIDIYEYICMCFWNDKDLERMILWEKK